MRTLLSILFTLLSVSMTFAQQEKIIDKVIGIVGDNPILYSEVEMQYQQIKSQGEMTGDFRCQLLDALLLDKLFLKQAQVDSIVVSQDEVDSELNRRIQYFISMFGTRENLEEYYGKTILELKDEFEEDIYKQLLAERMKGSIFQGMKVTPSEVKKFFENIPEDSLPFFNAEVELAQIVVYPEVSRAQKEYARTKLEKIRTEIEEGADFCLKAILESDDPGSSESCGELGYIRRGEMVPEFEAAAFRLEEGQISDVVETDFGFHIIQCVEKKGERRKIRHILIAPQLTSIEIGKAAALLDSAKVKMDKGTLTWAKAVEMYSEEENAERTEGLMVNQASGTSAFNMEELEPEMAFALDGLEVGDYTDPMKYQDEAGKPAYRIIKLVSETKPHKANLKQDYTKIQVAAKQSKQQEVLDEWVAEKSVQTYIFVDEHYKSCGEMDKWLHKE